MQKQKCLINFDVFLQYCLNAALERTSVASTTILFSTSGIFTLLISVFMGQDSINAVNLVSVFVSMAGVAMTIYGKTWATVDTHSTTSLYVPYSHILLIWIACEFLP